MHLQGIMQIIRQKPDFSLLFIVISAMMDLKALLWKVKPIKREGYYGKILYKLWCEYAGG